MGMCIYIFFGEIMITISFTQSSIPSSTHQPCIGGSGSFATAILVSSEKPGTCLRDSTRSIYIIYIYQHVPTVFPTFFLKSYMIDAQFFGGQFGMKYFWGTGVLGVLFRGTGICGFSLWRLMLKALLVFSAE